MRRSIFIVIINLLACSQLQAGGGPGIPGDIATSTNQIVDIVLFGKSLVNEALGLTNQVREISLHLKELETIGHHEWGNVSEYLVVLNRIVNRGQGISYSLQNLDETFRARYPGYVPSQNFTAAYQEWSDVTRESILGALEAAGFQSRNFHDELQTMRSLQLLSSTATGQKAAIQAGNMVSNQIVSQLQLLRQLTMAQIQAQTVYMTHKINKEAAIESGVDQFFHIIPEKTGGARY